MPARAPFILLLALLLASCKPDAGELAERNAGVALKVQAVRLALSKAKTAADIAPYDEALAWHEYQVEQVVSGELAAKTIRVAHWTVLHGQDVPVGRAKDEKVTLTLRPFEDTADLQDVASQDDLDISFEEVPRFIDMGQTLEKNLTPQALRYDYAGHFSGQMKLYWKLRGQLRLVVMGNSHATKGVCTGMFYPPENEQTPMALNLAPPGGNNHTQCRIVAEYVLPLPKLETVVWVMSPRSFNARRRDQRKEKEFFTSPGYLHDQANRDKLWPVPADAAPVTVKDLAALKLGWVDMWGWEGRITTPLPPKLEDARAELLDAFSGTRFRFDDAAWAEFREAVAALTKKGVRVLLLTPPYHPISRETPAADVDDTPHEAMKDFALKLAEFDAAEPKVWFRDFNQGGRHAFPHEEFYDADHVNRTGARNLTGQIIEWMKTCE